MDKKIISQKKYRKKNKKKDILFVIIHMLINIVILFLYPFAAISNMQMSIF